MANWILFFDQNCRGLYANLHNSTLYKHSTLYNIRIYMGGGLSIQIRHNTNNNFITMSCNSLATVLSNWQLFSLLMTDITIMIMELYNYTHTKLKKKKDLACLQGTWTSFLRKRLWGKLPTSRLDSSLSLSLSSSIGMGQYVNTSFWEEVDSLLLLEAGRKSFQELGVKSVLDWIRIAVFYRRKLQGEEVGSLSGLCWSCWRVKRSSHNMWMSSSALELMYASKCGCLNELLEEVGVSKTLHRSKLMIAVKKYYSSSLLSSAGLSSPSFWAGGQTSFAL